MGMSLRNIRIKNELFVEYICFDVRVGGQQDDRLVLDTSRRIQCRVNDKSVDYRDINLYCIMDYILSRLKHIPHFLQSHPVPPQSSFINLLLSKCSRSYPY